MATAREYAENIIKNAPLAVRAAKEAMVRGLDTTLEEGLRIELDLEYKVLQTQDFIEGTTAFAEKRKPNWKGS
jgi:enoyl-CoA hydratase